MKERIFLSSPHLCGEEMKYVMEAFETNWVAPLGKNVDAFEEELAAVCGRKYGVALSAGTHAIHLGLKLLGVGEGDYVFCSSLTFSGSCNAIAYEKAIPVYIDCDETWNMSPTALEKALVWAKSEGKLPKAVIIVDLYGQSADFDALLPICEKYGVPVLEDAAEALGTFYKGKPCGSFGDLSILSFNGNKIITTSGGGMLLTDNKEWANKTKFWATQARDSAPHYQHSEIGYNYRLSNVSAGIGRGQLHCLNERVEQKCNIYKRYADGFKDIADISMMPNPEGFASTNWLSVMTVSENSKVKPTDIINCLAENNIEARPVWKPMHMQPVFASCPFFSHTDPLNKDSLSEKYFSCGVCLPSDTKMTEEQQSVVTSLIRGCFGV